VNKQESEAYEELQREVARLKKEVATCHLEIRVARRNVRDSYMGAIISGLTAQWNWDALSPGLLVVHAERLLDNVLRSRNQWENNYRASLQATAVTKAERRQAARAAEIPTGSPAPSGNNGTATDPTASASRDNAPQAGQGNSDHGDRGPPAVSPPAGGT
jgi:hypothetical protein